MTGYDLERVAKFVQGLNALEREFRVRLDLVGSYDSKYLRIEAATATNQWEVVPYVGSNGDLELSREEPAK